MERVHVCVPASTANLGPGFDCLGLALDLWNEAFFEPGQSGIQVTLSGIGVGSLQEDARNLVARAAQILFQSINLESPPPLKIHCINRIPLGAGLGSSAAATLTGLLGANAMLPDPLPPEEIFRLAVQIEGHADNAAAAYHGGLVLIIENDEDFIARKININPEKFNDLNAAVAIPQIHLPTRVARAALPKEVPLADAVFNCGRTSLVIEAFRDGDLDLLGIAMQDRLHQPYRLRLVPGAEVAMTAARLAGMSGVAISGAGPSLIAFGRGNLVPVADRMVEAFTGAGVNAEGYVLKVSNRGATVEKTSG